MFDIPSIRLGKLFGIPFEINLSWIVIFVLVALSLTVSYYPSVPGAEGAPQWLLVVLGAGTALLFFASIIAHELCHALVTKIGGGQVERITLFIFGGVAQIEEEPKSPGRELLMASAGPAMSLLLAGACYLGYVFASGGGAPWWVWSPLGYLASINLFVGLFNLLPGFPLDGGRVLRALLWAITGDVLRATRWATRAGQFIGWGMVAFAVFEVVGGRTGFIWFGVVGWFIAWLAGASYRQQEMQAKLGGVTAGDAMTPHPEFVDGAVTIETFVHEHLLGRPHSRYPVILDGKIIGVVSLSGLKTVARPDWPYVRLADVTDTDLASLSVDASTPVQSVLPLLAAERTGALLVVRDGHLAGIMTRADIISILRPDQA